MKDWELNTTTKWKRHDDVNMFIFAVTDWCKRNIRSDKKYPIIWIDWHQKNHFGDYCWTDNEITIYPKKSETVEDIIDTVIHEWVHWTQIECNERMANDIAKQMTPKCWANLTDNE